MSNTPEYNLPKDAYVNFDALSLKEFMISQLNASGKFTDQNYEGSNISSLLDILAYYTHVLMFYLNQTSSESMFTQSTIYENMNKIVKLIGYKPTGKQTSLISIDCTASSTLTPKNYIIRKYSYFLVDNIQYTFPVDTSFDKVTTDTENIESISKNSILYQGTVGEYPIYTAEGVDYETIPIVVENLVSTKDTRFISHGTISVYVKEIDNDRWYEYEEADSLFLLNSTSRAYDIRLNENGHYEIKFGNGVFGRGLVAGDEVAIIYILSDGEKGLISKNAINGNKLYTYNTPTFNEIYISVNQDSTTIQITDSEKAKLTFVNPSNSTLIQEAETVDQIRENSPVFLASQLRLVTETDYENFLMKSIPNILNDVKVVDNTTYMNGYIDYFYNICVDPNKANRVILNQVNFADSCDFNNINIFCVPTFQLSQDEMYPDFMSNSFITLVKTLTNDKKIISNEVVPRDPVYMAVDLGFTNNSVSSDTYSQTKLIVVREKNDKTNKDTIKSKISTIILDYFDPTTVKLGYNVDPSEITSQILSIPGIKSIKTTNTVEGVYFNGISFIIWNPIFEGADTNVLNQATTLSFFKFPYLYRPNSLVNRIEVIDE